MRRRGVRRMTGPSGVGIGWRPEIAGFVAELPGLRFVEVVAEAVPASGPLPLGLAQLRERAVTVVPHGVRLSLGGAEPVDPTRVAHLAAVAQRVDAPLVSEHIAFVRAGGLEAGHLLPLPRSREAVDAVCANVARAQAELPVPIALEPIAALVDWPDDELDEADFLTEILDRTGALLLLDVANVHANARNRAPIRSRCWTDCRWTGSRTPTWPAARSTAASTTTPTPTRCRRRCWSCWARSAPGSDHRRCCWNGTATTRRPPCSAPNWTPWPPPPASRP